MIDVDYLGEKRQAAHPQGTPRYYDDPNKEDTIGVAGETTFARRYGLEVDERILPDGDGHIDFIVKINNLDISIDVKTAQRAYNLLIKEWEIKECADILVLAEYDDGVVKLLGWETKEVMRLMPTKVFSSLGINNFYRHNSRLRPMMHLDEIFRAGGLI